MTAWDIHVAEVREVLLKAGQRAAEYDAHHARVEQSVAEVLMALPSSPHVSRRVEQFNQEVLLPHLRAIVSDTSAALEGTKLALTAYEDGDELMARRTRDEAAKEPFGHGTGRSDR